MRQVLYVVLYVFLAALVLAGRRNEPTEYTSKYTPQPPLSPPPAAVPVAIIGDSYTRGSDMGGNGDHGWPVLIANQLSHQGVEINQAVGADRGSGYVNRGSTGTVFADQIPKVVVSKDRLVVLFGSMNDGNAPTDELSAAVDRTLADTKAAAPQAGLLVIGPTWIDRNPPARILRVRDVIKSQVEAIKATFVDPIADRWFVDNPELIGSDGVHPTDAGHAYLADKIAPLIAQQLEAPPTR